MRLFPGQELSLWDYDWASPNDEIGRATLALSALRPGQAADLWLDVQSESEISGGRAAWIPAWICAQSRSPGWLDPRVRPAETCRVLAHAHLWG